MRALLHGNPFAGINAKAIVGSGFLWAWLDATFMSVFFTPFGQQTAMAEAAAWGGSPFATIMCVVILCKIDAVYRLLAKRRFIAGIGIAGVAGSLLFIASAIMSSWALLLAGALLCVVFRTFAILAWGALYCRDGAKSAMIYVAGGFAFAFVLDMALLVVTQPIPAIVYAVFPLASCVLLLAIKERDRAYVVPESLPTKPGPTKPGTAKPEPRGLRGLAGASRRKLGISFPALCAILLIMVGFGYMQHLTSFSSSAQSSAGFALADGVVVQIVRGVAAMVLFLVIVLLPRRAIVVYRIGALVIVAGFLMMPFLSPANLLRVAGAVVIGGYTTFDVLIWVIAAQASYARKQDPLRMVCILRILINSVCSPLGAFMGATLAGAAAASFFPYADAIFVGYLMTIAVMLLLCSKEMWEFIDERPSASGADSEQAVAARIDQLAGEWGLTQREKEVFALLAVGRTQPWIAKNLTISESTVNTHVRHLYAKAGVSSRQDLLDFVISPSCESVDAP